MKNAKAQPNEVFGVSQVLDSCRTVELCINFPRHVYSFYPYDRYYVCLPNGWQMSSAHSTAFPSLPSPVVNFCSFPYTCPSGNVRRLDVPQVIKDSTFIIPTHCYYITVPLSDIRSASTRTITIFRVNNFPSPPEVSNCASMTINLLNTYSRIPLTITPISMCTGFPSTINLPTGYSGTTSNFTITPSTYTLTGSGTSFTFTGSAPGSYNIVYDDTTNCVYGDTTITVVPCRCDSTVTYHQNTGLIYRDTTITWTATSNPWGTNPVRVNGNIVLLSGSTLNLRGITLEFSPNSKILVDDNAKLDMQSNTTLKAAGNCMWQGVECVSYCTSTSPGRVFMRYSTIRDAHVGIGSGTIQQFVSTLAPQPCAGLVDVMYSSFINNHIGIHFRRTLPIPYTGMFHRVARTTFTCDGSLKEIFNPRANPSNRSVFFEYVTTNVNRPEFNNIANNNTYRNIGTTAVVSNQTKAIYSSQVGFTVRNCTFTNTQYGVYMISTPANPYSYCNINQNSFTYNTRGVTLFGVQGIVQNNEMYSGIINSTGPTTPTTFEGIGIFANNCGTLVIRENTIRQHDIGASIVNGSTMSYSTQIVGNSFVNNYLYCLGTGGVHDITSVTCNSFNGYVTDTINSPKRYGAWYIYDATVPAIMAQQGNPTTPAGNRFNSTLSSSFDIYTKTTNPALVLFTYYYGGTGAFIPIPISTNVNRIGIIANPIAYCASVLGPPMYPRMAPVILARLSTASTRQDSIALYTELYFRYLENQDTAGVRNILHTQNTLNAKRTLVEYYLSVGAVAQANAVLSALPTTTPDELIFKQYYTMQANHVWASKPCHTIDSIQENTVRTWRGQRGNLMGVLMSSLHRNCGDSVWVDCEMLGLCSTSSSSRYTQSTGITQEQKANTAYLGDAYPNPAQELIHIPYQLGKESATIEIYNIFGVKIDTYTVSDVYGIVSIPVSNLPKGLYIYTLTTQNGERAGTKKFMVQ